MFIIVKQTELMNKVAHQFNFSEKILAYLVDAGMPNTKLHYNTNGTIDGELTIDGSEYGFDPLTWLVETKNYIGLPQALKLLDHKNLFVAAEKIEPKARELFRTNGVSYIETDGALFLKGKGLLININKERKNAKAETIPKTSYTKAWVKFYLLLLTKPDMVNWPLREIAKASNLSLGTVSQLMKSESKAIKKIGTIPISHDLEILSELLDQWAGVIATTGLGQKHLGTFRMPINPKNDLMEGSVWSGEIAADLINDQNLDDDYRKGSGLRPDSGIIYTVQPIHEVMRELRLIPDPEGKLKIFDHPWNVILNKNGLAPLPIIIADLMQGDSRSLKEARNLETTYLGQLKADPWIGN